MKNIKTLVFDFDGTLVDSMDAFSYAITKILDDHGIAYPSDIIKTVTPLGYTGSAKYYIEHFGLAMTEQEAVDYVTECAVYEYTHNVMYKAGVVSTLKVLHDRGYSMNILTASPHSVLDVCLERLGIYGLFDNVWSCDDFGTTKADPEIYRSVACKLGVTVGECIFLDDNINSLATGKTAGMCVVGVHDKSSDMFREEIRELCGYYIDTMDKLLDILGVHKESTF